MSQIKTFEDIEAWQMARWLTRQIYKHTTRGEFARDFALRDQIRRAAISVMSNIAEGFERDGDKEFRQFLSIAKGSVGEVRAQLDVALDAGYIDDTEFKNLCGTTIEVAKRIGGFIRYLGQSSYSGTKFKNQNSPKPET